MGAAVDHVFICCSAGAPEAELLTGLGFREGSPNTHPGQGTACRRFFFRNAYLELIWVSDAVEARSEPAGRTRLWQRWTAREAGACPFGIVLRPDPLTREPHPPFVAWSYRPQYFPPDHSIEVALGTSMDEPELFFLPVSRRPDELLREPLEHGIPLKELTKVVIGIAGSGPRSPATVLLEVDGLVSFPASTDPVMSLSFDGATRGGSADLRPRLPLLLKW